MIKRILFLLPMLLLMTTLATFGYSVSAQDYTQSNVPGPKYSASDMTASQTESATASEAAKYRSVSQSTMASNAIDTIFLIAGVLLLLFCLWGLLIYLGFKHGFTPLAIVGTFILKKLHLPENSIGKIQQMSFAHFTIRTFIVMGVGCLLVSGSFKQFMTAIWVLLIQFLHLS